MMDWSIIVANFVAHKCVEEIVNVEDYPKLPFTDVSGNSG